ncbi:MAG: ABC transporter ATP-binding protein [Crenarchaeota archaeon]|nr:ABC transporter ATP-binding protein [Thermoproteota archaeon]
MIRLRGVWHRYTSRGRWVLRGADFTVSPGEAVLVVGPNGSGKTTLLKIAGLLLEPSRGLVEAWGEPFWSLPRSGRLRLRRRVVYVHEKPILVRGTVLENIALGLLLRGAPRGEALEAAREAAEALGIPGSLLGERARRLSRGLQQLVAVARALAVKPRVLILDEPFAHLDYRRRRLLAEKLEELRDHGTGVAVASHDTGLAARLADRVVAVEDGGVRPLETPAGG